jgi:hypothetical protein
MRKVLFIVLALWCVVELAAQDIIFTQKSDVIRAKVLEITDDVVKYKQFDFQDGPIFSLKKSEIKTISYQNGRIDHFSESATSDGMRSNDNECYIELRQCGLHVVCIDLNEEITWDEAMSRCPEGWRLPTLKELQCMCEYQDKLRIDEDDEYWSSKNNGNKAYSVTMDDCEDEDNYKSRTRAVRFVKSAW